MTGAQHYYNGTQAKNKDNKSSYKDPFSSNCEEDVDADFLKHEPSGAEVHLGGICNNHAGHNDECKHCNCAYYDEQEPIPVIQVNGKEDDPWALPMLKEETGTPWDELSNGQKAKKCVIIGGKIVLLISLLYFFICSLDLMSSAFRLIGGKTAGTALSNNKLLTNPVAGLMIGVTATILVQSSSTSTSIVVAMVASGILSVKTAIPIVMGANIGTSITNTIVSLAQVADRNMFRRAFAGATVHDMFNWLTVIILLPVEVATGYLYKLTKAIVSVTEEQQNQGEKHEFLKALTKPLTKKVVQLNKTVLYEISKNNDQFADASIVKEWCKFAIVTVNKTKHNALMNVTSLNHTRTNGSIELVMSKVGVEKCNTEDFLFSPSMQIADSAKGAILLAASLIVLIVCLLGIVKLLNTMLRGKVAEIIHKTINSELPGKMKWLTGYLAILIGTAMTILVQSSSVFTSTLTPLVGLGIISVDRMYPLTLGSNIGTTFTSLLAALATSKESFAPSLQIALCHFFFNITGIVIFYPIPPIRKIPIKLAKSLGNTTARYRWFPILYLLVLFVLLPGIVFALSLAGNVAVFTFTITLIIVVVTIIIINTLQSKYPHVLPNKLQSWQFLPKFMRSLEPLDHVMQYVIDMIKNCCPCCCRGNVLESTNPTPADSANQSMLPSPTPYHNEKEPVNDKSYASGDSLV